MSGFSHSSGGQSHVHSGSGYPKGAVFCPRTFPSISGAHSLEVEWDTFSQWERGCSGETLQPPLWMDHSGKQAVHSSGRPACSSSDLSATLLLGSSSFPISLPIPSLLFPRTTSQINYTAKSVSQALLSGTSKQRLCLGPCHSSQSRCDVWHTFPFPACCQ